MRNVMRKWIVALMVCMLIGAGITPVQKVNAASSDCSMVKVIKETKIYKGASFSSGYNGTAYVGKVYRVRGFVPVNGGWYPLADGSGYLPCTYVETVSETEPTVESKLMVKVTNAALIYQAPTSNSRAIGFANEGDTFETTGFIPVNGGWYPVYCNGTSGYISTYNVVLK